MPLPKLWHCMPKLCWIHSRLIRVGKRKASEYSSHAPCSRTYLAHDGSPRRMQAPGASCGSGAAAPAGIAGAASPAAAAGDGGRQHATPPAPASSANPGQARTAGDCGVPTCQLSQARHMLCTTPPPHTLFLPTTRLQPRHYPMAILPGREQAQMRPAHLSAHGSHARGCAAAAGGAVAASEPHPHRAGAADTPAGTGTPGRAARSAAAAHLAAGASAAGAAPGAVPLRK